MRQAKLGISCRLKSGIVIEEPYAEKPYVRFREGCGLTQLHYRDTEKEARA